MRLHHIGILVPDIPAAGELYRRRFGYQLKTEIVHDPKQQTYVQFMELTGDRVYIEFISPDRSSSHLTSALAKGGGLHHLCYATNDIETACKDLRSDGMSLVRAPVEAVAFHGRRIAWLIGRDRTLMELLEEGPEGEL